jgi:hypothetical protein
VAPSPRNFPFAPPFVEGGMGDLVCSGFILRCSLTRDSFLGVARATHTQALHLAHARASVGDASSDCEAGERPFSCRLFTTDGESGVLLWRARQTRPLRRFAGCWRTH